MTSLFPACVMAMISVFALLGALALVMELIIVLFPSREEGTDAATVAAITTTVASVYPGARVTHIEEAS